MSILTQVANVLLKQFVGINIGNITEYIKNTREAPEDFTRTFKDTILKKFENKKIVIIIDDLDRCDPENALQLLALLKLFLDIENIICIAAVDFKRLQQAWRHKYGFQTEQENTDPESNTIIDEGRDYLEKIFQLRIGIPKPSVLQVKEYLEKLVINVPKEIIEMISYTTPKNPRAIKRLLNLISFRGSVIANHHSRLNQDTTFAYESACIWTLLEENVTNDVLIYFYERMIANNSNDAKSLASLIYKYGNLWDTVKNTMNSLVSGEENKKVVNRNVMTIFRNSFELCKNNQITNETLETHFQILYKNTNESNN